MLLGSQFLLFKLNELWTNLNVFEKCTKIYRYFLKLEQNMQLFVSILDNLDNLDFYIHINLHLQILHHRVDKQYYMAGNKIPLQGRWAHFTKSYFQLLFIADLITSWDGLLLNAMYTTVHLWLSWAS